MTRSSLPSLEEPKPPAISKRLPARGTLALLLLSLACLGQRSLAGTPGALLISGDQDLLVLGQISEKQGGQLQIQVKRVLNGREQANPWQRWRRGWRGPRANLSRPLTVFYPNDSSSTSPALQVGDAVLASLESRTGNRTENRTGNRTGNRGKNQYDVGWAICKASSLEVKRLRLEDPCTTIAGGERAMVQWYVNSEGRDRDFFGQGNKTYVRQTTGGFRKNSQIRQIHPPLDPPARP